MISADTHSFLEPTRVVGASIRVGNNRPKFTDVMTSTIESTSYGDFVEDYNSTTKRLVQVFLKPDHTIECRKVLLTSTTFVEEVALTSVDIATYQPLYMCAGFMPAAAGISADTNGVIYHSDGVSLHRILYTNHAWGTSTLIASSLMDGGTRIAGMATFNGNVYLLIYQNGATLSIANIYSVDPQEDVVQWKGKINCDSFVGIKMFAAGQYLYIDMGDGKPVFLKVTDQQGNSFDGIVEPIISLDSLDDAQTFRLVGASYITYNTLVGGGSGYTTGDTVIIGETTRKNGQSMLVYMIGSDEFTMGQDYFIGYSTDVILDGVQNYSGTSLPLVYSDCVNDYAVPRAIFGSFWVIGNFYQLLSKLPVCIGGNSTYPFVINPSSIQVGMGGGGPNTLNVLVHSSLYGTVNAGDDLTLDLTCNGDTISYSFVVDIVKKSFMSNGQMLQISATSPRLRGLVSWESDNYYDYWSQSKSYGDAKDLTKMLRNSGTWETTDDGFLKLLELNEDGILYTVDRASGGSSIQAKLMRKSSDMSADFGVILNYTKETMADATVRLGRSASDSECKRSYIEVVHKEEVEYIDGIFVPGICVYYYDSTATPPRSYLGGWSLNLDSDVWYWIMAKYVNGHITVYHAAEDLEWTELGSCQATIPYSVSDPSQGDTGRSGIYLFNRTATSIGYEFQSDSSVIPVVDNSTFPVSDTVIVDDEQIVYGSKSGNVTVGPLDIVLGTIPALFETVSSNVGLCYVDKSCVVVRQRPSLSGTTYINAIMVYVQKIGAPSQGLELSICGTTNLQDIAGSRKATACISVADVSATAGWLTFKFDSQVEMTTTDTIQIKKNGGGSYQSSVNYYRIFGASGYAYEATRYNDTDDTWNAAGISMAFQVLAGPDPSVSAIPVTTTGNLSDVDGTYVNQALVITEGTGVGYVARITDYVYGAAECMVYTDIDMIQWVDETSKVSIVPALCDLTRGDPASSHEAVNVDVHRVGPLAIVDKFGYFSQEIDLSLEDVVRKIARYSGVSAFDPGKIYNGTIVPSSSTFGLAKKSMILSFSCGTITNYIDFHFRSASLGSALGINLRFNASSVEYYSSDVLVSSFPAAVTGAITISLFENYLSIWRENRPVHTFVLLDVDVTNTGDYFYIGGTSSDAITLNIPDAYMRIDNFVADMGKTGISSVQQIIGNKHFFMQDSDTGLKLFRTRKSANTISTPYSMVYKGDISKVEPALTRIYLEGGEVIEKISSTNAYDYGNLFHRETIFEVNNLDDANEFAQILLTDAEQGTEMVGFSGALWPKIEPQDTMYVTMPDGSVVNMIVDTVSYDVNVSGTGNTFDMNVAGRKI